ncbi:MAG TPA: hypothetical protein VFQ42_22070 [Mycobacterium sp.]|nr:hypothetical protein [Mycobacterium sp.]
MMQTNDFHTTLLWIRSLEIAQAPRADRAELGFVAASAGEIDQLFTRYRSPWRA